MSLIRRLKRLLNLKLYVTMKRFLTLKPPRTRSHTEILTTNQDFGPKATVNLAAVETAGHDTETFSHKTKDANSLEQWFSTFTKSVYTKLLKYEFCAH